MTIGRMGPKISPVNGQSSWSVYVGSRSQRATLRTFHQSVFLLHIIHDRHFNLSRLLVDRTTNDDGAFGRLEQL